MLYTRSCCVYQRILSFVCFFFFSSRRRHTRSLCDWSSDVCSSDLPSAYPEGCPQHPSYAEGHGAIAGACVTVLKAFFNENSVIPNPVVASDDGQIGRASCRERV